MTKQHKTHIHRLFVGVYWVFSISYLIMLTFTAHSYGFLHKALPIFVLLVVALKYGSKQTHWLLLALLFSATGDILLALPIPNSFIFGLGAFLLAQCCYALLFKQWCTPDKNQGAMIWLLTLFLFVMALIVIPNSAELAFAVIPYMGVIWWMAYSAIRSTKEHKTIVVGALFFVVSDSLIAINKFVFTLPMEGLLIMSTYYVAQYLLVTGAINRNCHD